MASFSQAPSVVFLDIVDEYSYSCDLSCKFKVNTTYQTRGRDSVAIYKLGWKNVMEYVAIKRVPDLPESRMCSVTFNRHVLPKNTVDLFQICYISGQDLHGASTPFQFAADESMIIIPDHFSKNAITSFSSSTDDHMAEKEQEINMLKEENSILKESLKTLLASKVYNTSTNYDEDIKEFKELVEGFRSMLLAHDNDIKMLKSKIRDCGEEYKKLYMEKYKAEKKYEKLKGALIDKSSRKTVPERTEPINNFNLDLDELASIPPFPSIRESLTKK